MNDESVSHVRDAPIRLKNAYILFYIRNRGARLETAVNSIVTSPLATPKALSNGGGVVAGMKKRKVPAEEEEDHGEKVSRPFIGPILPAGHSTVQAGSPPPVKRQKTDEIDPQAEAIKNKITKATSSNGSAALQNLDSYHSEEEEPSQSAAAPSSPAPASSPPVQPLRTPQQTKKLQAIPTGQFYSSVSKHRPGWLSKKEGLSPYSNRLGGGRKRVRPL